MELTNHEKQMLRNTMTECVKHADCELLEKVFEAADWQWADFVTDEHYSPTAREIRAEFYRLAKSVLERIIKSYEDDQWRNHDPLSVWQECGRLRFEVYWLTDKDDNSNFVSDIQMNCCIKTDVAISNISEEKADTYDVMTYVDEDHDYIESFDKIGE